MLEVRQTMFMSVYELSFYAFNFPCHSHIKSQQYDDKIYPFHIHGLVGTHALHQYGARSDNPQTENVFTDGTLL